MALAEHESNVLENVAKIVGIAVGMAVITSAGAYLFDLLTR